MPKIRCFEDIEAWQKSRGLTNLVYRLSGSGPWAKDFALRDQVREASISIMSNIAEGFERIGDAELAHFLSMAKGSTGEVRAQLYVALDQKFIDQKQFESSNALASETGRLIGGFIRYLKMQKPATRDPRPVTRD